MYALKSCAISLLMVFLWATTAVLADELQLLTEENPPFNFTRDGQITGLYPEVIENILRRTGDQGQIAVMPWARGYRKALHETDVALFAMARTPEREALFQWVGPFYSGVTGFYAKRGAGVKIGSLEDAKALKSILVVRDWVTHRSLVSLGFTNLEVVNAPENVARMLMGNRSAVMFVTARSLPDMLGKVGAQVSDVELVYSQTKYQGYIAFSLGTSPDLVKRWQQALDEMKKEGSYAAIFAKWLPGEKPPGIRSD